jgi:hypothetical protein
VQRAGVVVQGKVHGMATVAHFQASRTGCVARRMAALRDFACTPAHSGSTVRTSR